MEDGILKLLPIWFTNYVLPGVSGIVLIAGTVYKMRDYFFKEGEARQRSDGRTIGMSTEIEALILAQFSKPGGGSRDADPFWKQLELLTTRTNQIDQKFDTKLDTIAEHHRKLEGDIGEMRIAQIEIKHEAQNLKGQVDGIKADTSTIKKLLLTHSERSQGSAK